MGAELWNHLAPWRPEPEEALIELQIDYLSRNYDLKNLLAEHRQSARDSVRLCEADGDEYGLLAMYRETLGMLDEMADQPLPSAPRDQVEWIRRIFADSGQGVGNVLDVTGVSDRGGLEARTLEPPEIRQFCATDRPTIAQAESASFKINEILGRGESVCFRVYDDEATPVGWYFVGNTID